MSLGNDLLTLRNFVNSKIANNNSRNITGTQLNSAFTQLLNIITGVVSLANITRTDHIVVIGDIVSDKTVIVLSELVDAELFLVSSQASIYFPIDDLADIPPGDSNLYYSFEPSTGTITTLDFSTGYLLNIYYRPGPGE